MTTFIQIHFLTAYPASCLVRDDMGRPKTLVYGGTPRARISSAALKRAIRTSEVFRNRLDGFLGQRTQRLGVDLHKALTAEGVESEAAHDAARKVAGVFGKIKADNDKDRYEIEQLAFIDPEERDAALAMARRLAAGNIDEAAVKEQMESLIHGAVKAVDIALFGRMFADRSEMRMTAAAEVAHPFSVDRAEVESDYYVAVDDLNDRREDAGSAFIGEQGYISGLFYGYTNINRDLLIDNLGGDAGLADRAIAAYIDAVAKVSPTGKIAAFGTRAHAGYIRVERGSAMPRSLAAAFLTPVRPDPDTELLQSAIARLEKSADSFNRAYGDAPDHAVINVDAGIGTMDEVQRFAVAGGAA